MTHKEALESLDNNLRDIRLVNIRWEEYLVVSKGTLVVGVEICINSSRLWQSYIATLIHHVCGKRTLVDAVEVCFNSSCLWQPLKKNIIFYLFLAQFSKRFLVVGSGNMPSDEVEEISVSKICSVVNTANELKAVIF